MGLGPTTLVASLVGWPEGNVAPVVVAVEVARPLTKLRPEPVSKRLVRSVPHPERTASFSAVAFRNNRELVVVGYPSGVVQFIDPHAGKTVREVRAPHGYHGSRSYLQISRDRNLLAFGRGNSKFEPLREGEKTTYYRLYHGETQMYDLRSAKQVGALTADPRRGVFTVALSPDGRKMASMEYRSGKTADFDRLRSLYLWDLDTRKEILLRDGHGDLYFSCDSKIVYIVRNDYAAKKGTLFAHSAQSGKLLKSRESKDGLMSPLAIGERGLLAVPAKDAKTGHAIIQLLSQDTLEVRATLTADLPDSVKGFNQFVFSSEEKYFAAVSGNLALVWEVASKKLVRSWKLDTSGYSTSLEFSPKGDKLAVSTFYVPPELRATRDEAVTPQDYPQPRVFLLMMESGKAETLIAPHGWAGLLAFSPDGKLLALSGAGAVHLFDVAGK